MDVWIRSYNFSHLSPVKAEIDKDLAERTNWRLPRYKCKNCDMLWDNYRYNGGA